MDALTNLIIKEGWGRVSAALVASIVLALFGMGFLALVALLLTLGLVWIYRKPERSSIHFEKGSVTSPCDGKVTAVRTERDGTQVVEIESGLLDASVLSTPFECMASPVNIVRGAMLSRQSPLFDLLNEHASLTFTDIQGHTVHVIHRLKRCAAPLAFDQGALDAGLLGSRPYGVMLNGLTSIRLPASSRIAVNPGERVTGAETLLGYIGR